MRILKKIILVWLGSVAVCALSLKLLPHKNVEYPEFANYCVQFLLFALSACIAWQEPVRKNKFIFLNFALVFSLSILFHLYNFVGTLFFPESPYARFFVFQYGSVGAYCLLLSLAIVYITIDLLFRDFKTRQKYLLSVSIVLLFFGSYFYPFFIDPMHAYHTQDVQDWKTMDVAYRAYKDANGAKPTPQTLANAIELHAWQDGKRVGTLYPEEKLNRVIELYPYLMRSNWMVLLFKPLYMNIIYMSVLCIGFILLFFGYQYLKDPPQGAYIEKVMLLFLIFSTLEIFHAWRSVKAIEWQALSDVFNIGQYMTICVLLSLAAIFSLRLSFIKSAKGEFYENELALNPNGITRWRDALDQIVIEKFFDRKLILGRMFVKPESK